MMIEISGKPAFSFKPTLTLLQTIETCAIMHYDSTCRAAAAQGGLIQRAIQSFAFYGPEAAFETWCFRELDTVLKICENPPRIIEANATALLADFVKCAHKALQRSNELAFKWRESVRTNGENSNVQDDAGKDANQATQSSA